MKSTNITSDSWWRSYQLEIGSCRQIQVGPINIYVCCYSNEWLLAYVREDEQETEDRKWLMQAVEGIPDSISKVFRYVFRATTGVMTLSPKLADRSVISRPRTPFNLIAGEEVIVYVSSPVWILLSVGEAKKRLEEIGVQRPSDTWFGPSTLEGELCYASSTHCRMEMDELSAKPYRAITPVHIRNQANSTLAIERLLVPSVHLSLYETSSGQLWTPRIHLTRHEDGEMAALKIDKKPPVEAKGAKLVSSPRQPGAEGMLVRAFNAVFN